MSSLMVHSHGLQSWSSSWSHPETVCLFKDPLKMGASVMEEGEMINGWRKRLENNGGGVMSRNRGVEAGGNRGRTEKYLLWRWVGGVSPFSQ